MKLNSLSAVFMVTILCNNIKAIPNFDLINADPKNPIHVSANGGAWQTLNQQHYRFPIEVPENSLLVLSLSANDDKSTPTSLIFAPERALETAKQVGSKTSKAPTFYVQATITIEKIPGSDKIIKHVQLSPQVSAGTTNKTKYGLPLDNNVTQEMIDLITGIATTEQPDTQERTKTEIISTTKEIQNPKTDAPQQPSENKLAVPIKTSSTTTTEIISTPINLPTQNPEHKQAEAAKPTNTNPKGPLTQKTPLQHTDTPQMIETQLKKITKEKDSVSQWTDIRNYLAKDLFKDKDDAYIYNQFKKHYQALADKTTSNLKKTYTRIVKIITNTYKAAHH